jgi:hypothetical protein
MRKKPMCVQHRGGWCALAPGAQLDPTVTRDPTLCGYVVMLRSGSERRDPTCLDCIAKMKEQTK